MKKIKNFDLHDEVEWQGYKGIVHTQQIGGYVTLFDEAHGRDIVLFDDDHVNGKVLKAGNPKNKFQTSQKVLYNNIEYCVLKVTWKNDQYIYTLMETGKNKPHDNVREEEIFES